MLASIGTIGHYLFVSTGGHTQMACIIPAWMYLYIYSVLVFISRVGSGGRKENEMATCRECGTQNVVERYCELCGNYGCIECNDHCPGCTNHMEELEE